MKREILWKLELNDWGILFNYHQIAEPMKTLSINKNSCDEALVFGDYNRRELC